MAYIRINKFLAEQGIASRRGADELIASGRVRVNGRIAEKGMLISGDERIEVDAKFLQVKPTEYKYYAFYKPVGILSSVDPNGRDTIATFLKLQERLFHVGRLDVASEGLLLLTNDGVLAEAITHPKGNHEKEYLITVRQPLKEQDLAVMAKGMVILGKKTKPAKVKQLNQNQFSIVLTEGRNRQIRRMCEQLGYEVKKLKRVRVMNVRLGELAAGEIRPLSAGEVKTLKRRLRSVEK